jgi:hypothetical protein
MREELLKFLEAGTPKLRAAFFSTLGMELSVLARILYSQRRGSKTSLLALQEMQHCCFGQINAYVYELDDLLTPDMAVAILCQYADEAEIRKDVEAAVGRARRLAETT